MTSAPKPLLPPKLKPLLRWQHDTQNIANTQVPALNFRANGQIIKKTFNLSQPKCVPMKTVLIMSEQTSSAAP
jgi:hypothetical protein